MSETEETRSSRVQARAKATRRPTQAALLEEIKESLERLRDEVATQNRTTLELAERFALAERVTRLEQRLDEALAQLEASTRDEHLDQLERELVRALAETTSARRESSELRALLARVLALVSRLAR